MEHVVTIDRRAALAFERTQLSIALERVHGPRTPFSSQRTVVPLPDTNPEDEDSLAGALEKTGRDKWPPNLGRESVDGDR